MRGARQTVAAGLIVAVTAVFFLAVFVAACAEPGQDRLWLLGLWLLAPPAAFILWLLVPVLGMVHHHRPNSASATRYTLWTNAQVTAAAPVATATRRVAVWLLRASGAIAVSEVEDG